MVILYLYDSVNGYRYRRLSLGYYERNMHSNMIISAWIIEWEDNFR